jgi:hypothetical protein
MAKKKETNVEDKQSPEKGSLHDDLTEIKVLLGECLWHLQRLLKDTDIITKIEKFKTGVE